MSGYKFSHDMLEFLKKNSAELGITDVLAEKLLQQLHIHETVELIDLQREDVFVSESCLNSDQQSKFWNMVENLETDPNFTNIFIVIETIFNNAIQRRLIVMVGVLTPGRWR